MIRKRSKFNLSKTALTTFDPGEFVPIGLTEVVPGDSIKGKTDAIIRALPMLAPVMHEVEVIVTHSFIPHRLVWEDFEDFITGGDDGLNASTLPTIDFSGSPVSKGDLANYLGLPVGFNLTASALPFRAYALFYNDHLRDEELQTELTIDLTSGTDTTTSTDLKNVNWARDRLTGAAANEQLGTAISLPLGTTAPILGIGMDTAGSWTSSSQSVHETDNASTTFTKHKNTSSGTGIYIEGNASNNNPAVYADLTNATAATINQLREAIALQKFAEMRQLYGSTYEKLLKYDYGTSAGDARLQNSEILSRSRGFLKFSEVLATAETGSTVDVGDMKGHGISATRTKSFIKTFQEFGYLMSFVAVRPKAVYSQGADKHWFKNSKDDFYNPHLENMGVQQAILNKEVKFDHSTPGGTFGYEPTFNEYRSQTNSYHGDFDDSSLNYWHMGRDLSGDPALNSSFITCSPTNRVFAQTTTDNLLGMFRNKFVARRLLKKSVKPVGLI
jgi:hypothetical protein